MDWIIQAVFFMDPVEGENDENKSDTPDWCKCKKIWDFFGNVFDWKCCESYRCCKETHRVKKQLEKFSYRCLECDCGSEDLENKKLPHHHKLKVRKDQGKWYCGCIKLNMNRIGIYLLLCACFWCGSIAFFEAIILAYASVNSGDSCPVPKKGTPSTVVECFIYQNRFDTSPINTNSPTQCNGTTALSFSGFRAGCFAWVYANVEVGDVIEELGICAGIIASLGTVVVILYYLCRKHRWRLLFDNVACMSIAAIPILFYREGNLPFITFILLGSLCAVIIITEYLLNYVPLLTSLCLLTAAYQWIKTCGNPNKRSQVRPYNQN
jgi:hypothetical protein